MTTVNPRKSTHGVTVPHHQHQFHVVFSNTGDGRQMLSDDELEVLRTSLTSFVVDHASEMFSLRIRLPVTVVNVPLFVDHVADSGLLMKLSGASGSVNGDLYSVMYRVVDIHEASLTYSYSSSQALELSIAGEFTRDDDAYRI